MFQKLGGVIGDIVPLIIFIYLSLILLGIIHLKNDIRFFKSNPTISKIIVFGAVVIFAILVIMGLASRKKINF